MTCIEIKHLIEEGYLNHILISQDVCTKLCYVTFGLPLVELAMPTSCVMSCSGCDEGVSVMGRLTQ